MQNPIRFLLLFRNPFLALRDRFNLIKRPLVEHRLRNGLTFWCRPGSSDLMSVWDIFSSQNHSDYLRQFTVMPGDTVVDIGANIGVFALQCAARGARVYAYEPIADTFRTLLTNINANQTKGMPGHVEAYRLGVARKNGRRPIYLGGRNHSMSCSFYPGDDTTQDAITIDTVPFLDTIRNLLRIDFLKIDCEGAEFEFFNKLPAGALSCVRRIALEYHEVETGFRWQHLEAELRQQGFNGIDVVPWKPRHGIIYAWREA